MSGESKPSSSSGGKKESDRALEISRDIKNKVREIIQPLPIRVDSPLGNKDLNRIKKAFPDIYNNKIKPLIDNANKKLNKNYKNNFENSNSVFRGTNVSELDDMLESGVIGRAVGEFNFHSVTTDSNVANVYSLAHDKKTGEESHKTLIEYDKESLGKNIKSPGYAVQQDRNPSQINTPNKSIEIGDMEHRIKRGVPFSDVKMKIIISDVPKDEQESFISKYSELSEDIKFD